MKYCYTGEFTGKDRLTAFQHCVVHVSKSCFVIYFLTVAMYQVELDAICESLLFL